MLEQKYKKVKVFKWKGKNRRGRRVKGEIVSPHKIDASLELEKRGIVLKTINEKSFNGLNPFSRIIRSKDITIFTRQLGNLILSKLGLVEALRIAADSLFHPKLKSIVIDLKNKVAAGDSFSNALSSYPKYFDQVYINMIQSGEENGVLGETLISISEHREKNEKMGAELKKAMVYPTMIVLFAIAVVTFMLVKIIPQFEKVYATYNSNLPAYTEFVLNIAKFMQHHLFLIISCIVVFSLLVHILKKTSYSFRLFLSKMALKLPVLKNIFKRLAMVKFFQTTLITYKSGLSLGGCIKCASESMDNYVYKEILNEVKEDVLMGEKLTDALKSTGMFPEMAIQFIESGEESGEMEDSLYRGAYLFESEMDDYFIIASKALEPLIMIAVSFLVGAIVVAMYLPIFYFGSIIS